MKTLTELYKNGHASTDFKQASDKGTAHTYIRAYENLFEPLRSSVRSLLEVGIASGHSLLLWREYFESAKIYGIDIQEPPAILSGVDRIYTAVCDSTACTVNTVFPWTVFDIIIDDGCHMLSSQLLTLSQLFSRLVPGGLYIVEDVGSERGLNDFKKYGDIQVFGTGVKNDRLVVIKKGA